MADGDPGFVAVVKLLNSQPSKDANMALLSAEKDWKRLGEIDPYYGVLIHDKFKSININDDAKQEFFASGVCHVEKVLAVLSNSYGFVPRGTALDFGCGVGRITNALAPQFEAVIGLDIAPGMLVEARRYSANNGFTNIEYDSSLNESRLRPEGYDFVHTYIVLQHIPISMGENIIRALVLLSQKVTSRAISESGIGRDSDQRRC
jgi:2-polyprenyl-3-methyl-5-hydroxy-6-metoxy-1,4-benzoquinol methylase